MTRFSRHEPLGKQKYALVVARLIVHNAKDIRLKIRYGYIRILDYS